MSNGQIQIPGDLKSCIRNFWTLESDGSDDAPKPFTVFADGCPGIIFQQPDSGILFQREKKLPSLFLYGQATKASEIRLSGKFSAIGIYLYPNSLKAIFGIDAEELTDSCLDLDLLGRKQGFSLQQQLADAPSVTDKASVLTSYVALQVKAGRGGRNQGMEFAINQIAQSKGTISLTALQKQLLISERSFERRFKNYVGISPKLFARISRFQASLSQLRKNKYNKLSDIAYENDYADQSHFIRSFKEFTGFTPNQFQSHSTEIVENLSQTVR